MSRIIIGISLLLVGCVMGIICTYRIMICIINELKSGYLRLNRYNSVLLGWLKLHQSGNTISKYLNKRNFKKIIIYGKNELGEILSKELEREGFELICFIDRNAESILCEVPIISPEDDIPNADVIVVAASYYFADIYAKIKEKTNCKIVSIDDLFTSP